MLNLFAAVVAALVAVVLGIAWYSQPLFGRQWMKVIGKKGKDLDKSEMPSKYVSSFVGYLVIALVLATVMSATGAQTIFQGAIVGAVFSLGVAFMASLPCVLFECRPFGAHLIMNAYHLVAFVVMGVLLAAWQ